jgi:CRISPR-associated protein Csy2
VHALERRFPDQLREGFGGVGIVCHRFDPQVTKASYQALVFNLTRNPLRENGQTASFVEEGRAHLEVTLLIAVCDYMTRRTGDDFARDVMHALEGMRLAGGSILPTRPGDRFQAEWLPLDDDTGAREEQFVKLRRRLLPGFALVEREDLLVAHMEELRQKAPQANALDALLDLSRLNVEPDIPNPDKPGETMWGIRSRPGWLVPLPIGYAALTEAYEPGQVKGARDGDTPFRFVECLYSLGEWVSPHRMRSIDQMLWRHEADTDKGIYRCVNSYSDDYTTIASEGA